MAKQEVTLGCDACNAMKLSLGEHSFAGMVEAEHWSDMAPLAAARGWAIRQDGGRWRAICPACLAKEEQQKIVSLADYSGPSACPKCLADGVAVKFCRGAVPCCPIMVHREHVHRVCKSCGYDWVESCADESHRGEKWKRIIPWLRRLWSIRSR